MLFTGDNTNTLNGVKSPITEDFVFFLICTKVCGIAGFSVVLHFLKATVLTET